MSFFGPYGPLDADDIAAINAVARFLAREGEGVADYLDHLAERSPLKAG